MDRSCWSSGILSPEVRRFYGMPVQTDPHSPWKKSTGWMYEAGLSPEKLIPLMISRALADEELPVYGDGANVRDWLHVSDHCEAIDLILRKMIWTVVVGAAGYCHRKSVGSMVCQYKQIRTRLGRRVRAGCMKRGCLREEEIRAV